MGKNLEQNSIIILSQIVAEYGKGFQEVKLEHMVNLSNSVYLLLKTSVI